MASIVEIASVTFSNADSVTYTFEQPHSQPPIVTATCDQDVNVHVSSVTTHSAVIQASAKSSFTVKIHIFSMMVYPC